MSVFKSNTIYIIILTCYSLGFDANCPYIAALILSILPLDKPIISTILTLFSLIPSAIQIEPISIFLIIITISVHLYYHGVPGRSPIVKQPENAISSKVLIFIYFFCFSFLSLASFIPTHYIYLVALYIMLIIYSVNAIAVNNYLRYVIIICSWGTLIWGVTLKLANMFNSTITRDIRNWGNEQWWYYFMINLSSWLGFMLSYQISYQQNNIQSEDNKSSKKANFSVQRNQDTQMIQMRVFSSQSVDYDKQLKQDLQNKQQENRSQGQSNRSRRNILPPIPHQLVKHEDSQIVKKLLSDQDDMNLKKHRQYAKSALIKHSDETQQIQRKNKKLEKRLRPKQIINFNKNKKKQKQLQLQHQKQKQIKIDSSYSSPSPNSYSIHEGQSQQQITNLFLLIPFTLFKPSFLQIPIYFYLIWLQSGKTPMWVFYVMYISICIITLIEDTSTLKFQILLRLCLILIVNKNFKLAVNITRVLRSIWLRSSFVFVLLVLFWFSLLTVNLFHISFVLIVLLFITRNNDPHSQQPSFRHRNWKYLMILFNIFLALRLLFLISQRDIAVHISQKFHQILGIIGITYSYGLNWQYFNMIPLIVSGVLTVQYWTYSSRIYDLQSKKTLQFLPTYRALIQKIIQILTIIYYKLIPWASHFLVIIIIISLQFSLIADLVLIWSLFILLIHMIKPNQLSAYRKMYKMWDIFLKLVSIQIILRYIFQFIKFPIIFIHISQLPIIKSLVQYQQLLGLAIRQSSNSYIKNVFTKFQLMMILDFSIIAISFLTIQYYQIMIKYFQMEGKDNLSSNNFSDFNKQKSQKIQKQKQQQKQKIKNGNNNILNQQLQQNKQNSNIQQSQQHTITSHDAIYIYEKYIDFKLTKWLQNFNQFMLTFSKLFLKIYYPILGIFSCLYYSYATLIYFLFCVYYYLKINLKYYQLYAYNQVQFRIMKLFHLWRLQNNIRVNLVQKQPIHTDQIIIPKNQIQMKQIQQLKNKQNKQKQFIMHQQLSHQLINQHQQIPQKATTKDPITLYRQLKKQILIVNYRILFDNFINLHIKLRFWLLIITMICVILNYTSRLFMSDQIDDFFSQNSIVQFRYLLFMCGTSIQSPISIQMYLFLIGLTVIQIKCCSLATKIGRRNTLQSEMIKNQQNQNQQLHNKQKSEKSKKQQMKGMQTKQVRKFIDVSISLRLGINKIMERFFVILLVFVSLLQNQNPFSIIYLVCAWFLNYMGSRSIQGLSWTLSFLVVLQYSLIITDTTNKLLGASQLFPNHIHHSWLIQLFKIQNNQWITYLQFGNHISQIFVLCLSLIILILYQLCFYIQQYNWIQILDKMFQKINIGGIYLKLYQKISQIYQYALVYSPLFIITLCLGLYLMDFTATNMFLSILSIIFLFKSFLLQNYTNSRPFWKSYFRILQLLIVIFMVVYCILSAPMYNQYCNKVLCSPQQFRTKITKTILLLILQIGIDLISSHHFINAMATLQNTLNQTSSFYRIAISVVQNDRKIEKSFQSIKRKQNIKQSITKVKEFLQGYQSDSTIRFDHRKQIQTSNQSWIDTLLSFMPSFIDASLIKGPQQTRQFVKQQNKQFIQWLQNRNNSKLSEQQLKNINQLYINQFAQCQTIIQLKTKINSIISPQSQQKQKQQYQRPIAQSTQLQQSKHIMHRQRKISFGGGDGSNDDLMRMSQGNIRKSYIQGIMPYQDQLQIGYSTIKRPTNNSIKQVNQQKQLQFQQQNQLLKQKQNKLPQQNININNSRKSIIQQLSNVNQQQKKKLLYLKIFQSIVSNWHYLTYTLMILQFIINMGILTLPFPILTFSLGIIHSYQAPKNVWRLTFLALLPPIFFKYSLQIQLIKINKTIEFILIGSNNTSIIIQYLLMFFIVIQCLILKIAGLYDQSTAQVQCMNIALIRNIINVDQNNQTKQQQRKAFYTLLQKSKQPSQGFFQYIFSLYQCKIGYDYSTLMVTIQIINLIYIFCFYDNMAIRQQLTFYKMIEYNQFTTGMVIMAFIQLGFMLLDRIMTVLQLTYKKWDITLILKYIILIISLIYIHVLVLVFFPINSDYYNSNKYIIVFYILNIYYFLISALQVKVGINKQSRGFIDRYSWYNGYIYMFYRAIPFLFEFKVFSDWTFTTTSLRLFDWIKYQEILGYLYVAKCNSLFLRGKILGSKIQWWKKLLMGFPLLLTIILLLFGPLILFSSLNPLASLNQITGGYLELSLKINKTNQYPFYINTHITDIHFLDKQPDQQLQQIIKTYQLDQKSIQIVHLQPFSDQYWQISQGSYNKLIDQPQTSLYQLTIRVKFDRNQTKTTPVYILNTYNIPIQRVHQFKQTLQGHGSFKVQQFVPSFMRLDNNNGLHYLNQQSYNIVFHAQESRTLKKKYWVINDGITFKMASDKYSKAIFGYSVMSFYISIILVVANYFRFLFQGSAYTIIMSDIPYADSILSICDGIYQARLRGDIKQQQILFWTLVDIIRSPDLMKALTGNYLNARIQTLQQQDKYLQQQQPKSQIIKEKKFIRKQD